MRNNFLTSEIRASKELDSTKRHTISPDGYNIGRDWLVERAVRGGRWKGMWWKADVEWRTDLIKEGKKGLPLRYSLSIKAYNFFVKKGVNHGIAQDGRVAILTVVRL